MKGLLTLLFISILFFSCKSNLTSTIAYKYGLKYTEKKRSYYSLIDNFTHVYKVTMVTDSLTGKLKEKETDRYKVGCRGVKRKYGFRITIVIRYDERGRVEHRERTSFYNRND